MGGMVVDFCINNCGVTVGGVGAGVRGSYEVVRRASRRVETRAMGRPTTLK